MEEKKAMVEVEYLKVTPEEEPLGTITKHTGPVEITAPDPEGGKSHRRRKRRSQCGTEP